MQATFPKPETTQPTTRLRGFIKDLNKSRGFCFVHVDDGTEYFMHFRDLEGGEKAMVSRAIVEFTPLPVNVPGKSPRAVDAVVLSNPRESK